MLIFNYGGMPHQESLASIKLFAKEVLPVLKRMPTPGLVEHEEKTSVSGSKFGSWSEKEGTLS
jgi:hypothetical protein